MVLYWPFSPVFCTTKKALDQDRYEESGRCCVLVLPIPVSETRTRMYVNGHPTNGFVKDDFDTHWYRDPGCAAAEYGVFFEEGRLAPHTPSFPSLLYFTPKFMST